MDFLLPPSGNNKKLELRRRRKQLNSCEQPAAAAAVGKRGDSFYNKKETIGRNKKNINKNIRHSKCNKIKETIFGIPWSKSESNLYFEIRIEPA